MIASTVRDQGAAYSPDGLIAFTSDPSGGLEIWIARGDGSKGVQVTYFNGSQLGHLQWLPDGGPLPRKGCNTTPIDNQRAAPLYRAEACARSAARQSSSDSSCVFQTNSDVSITLVIQ